MNIDFEMALRYINLGDYDKAVEGLNKAISAESEKGNESVAAEYRCVLGELFANTGKTAEAREEFVKVLGYCDSTHSLPKQREIARTFLGAFDGELRQRPGDIPLIPKPAQNKAFISKRMNKRGK